MHDKVVEEAGLVALTNTVTDPRAVVVVSGDAVIAGFAVLGSQGLLKVAHSAILHLNEKLHLVWVRVIIVFARLVNGIHF